MYAIMSDIKGMYYQMFVSLEDGDALLFVWYKFSSDSIKHYRMSVYTFAKIEFICFI